MIHHKCLWLYAAMSFLVPSFYSDELQSSSTLSKHWNACTQINMSKNKLNSSDDVWLYFNIFFNIFPLLLGDFFHYFLQNDICQTYPDLKCFKIAWRLCHIMQHTWYFQTCMCPLFFFFKEKGGWRITKGNTSLDFVPRAPTNLSTCRTFLLFRI